jgi:hypothetical protein
MPRPRFVDIDGRRYLWRDLVQIYRAQREPRQEQPTLFRCTTTGVRLVIGMPASATGSPASSPGVKARRFSADDTPPLLPGLPDH